MMKSTTSGSIKQYSADESLAIITFFEDSSPGQHYWTFNYMSAFPNATLSKDFPNDALAAGGVELGEQYHTAGIVKIRLT